MLLIKKTFQPITEGSRYSEEASEQWTTYPLLTKHLYSESDHTAAHTPTPSQQLSRLDIISDGHQ